MIKKETLSSFKLIRSLATNSYKSTGLYKNNKVAKTNILLKKYVLSKQITNESIAEEIEKLRGLKNIVINIHSY